MCKLSFIHLVNENSSILSLLLLFSSIFFATLYVNSELYLLCAGSTHLHYTHLTLKPYKGPLLILMHQLLQALGQSLLIDPF
jgi:hypothetical protein